MCKKSISFFSLAIVILLVFSCNNPTEKKSTEEIEDQNPNFEAIVLEWNKAHNEQDFNKFSELYFKEVNFYQANLSGKDCAIKKENLLKKFNDFKQTIGELSIEKINDEEYKCSFVKTCTMNGKSFDYPSYLVFKKSGSAWKISAESDLVTDENIQKMNLPENAVVGDFNADGAPEYMWLIQPKFPKNQTEENVGECVGDCNCIIEFSNENIPPITLEMCIGGYPVNEGDLDGDGTDEIGILPEWWTSCWQSYYVYSLKNGNWNLLVEPISTHCNQWDDGVDAIFKTPGKKGFVTINYSVFDDEGINVESMEIRVD